MFTVGAAGSTGGVAEGNTPVGAGTGGETTGDVITGALPGAARAAVPDAVPPGTPPEVLGPMGGVTCCAVEIGFCVATFQPFSVMHSLKAFPAMALLLALSVASSDARSSASRASL